MKAPLLPSPHHLLSIAVMEAYARSTSFLLLFAVVSLFSCGCLGLRTSSGARIPASTNEFIRTRCNATDYPRLCLATLSSYAPMIGTSPIQMANAALNVTLSNAQWTAAVMARLSTGSGRMSRKEAVAVSDCVEGLTDSVEYLSQSLNAMGDLKGKDVKLRINDAQTWVSTALTDESTCMQEFAGGAESKSRVKNNVRAHVVKVARLTRNALSLINAIAATESVH